MAQVIKRSQVAAFLDTTPTSETDTFNIMGKGLTDLSYAYNPNVTTSQYINEDNATSTLNNYAVQLDGTQIAYKGDAVFDFINGLRKTLAVGEDAETNLLLVDVFDNNYAQKFNCTVAITSFGGTASDPTKIGYTVYCNGNPVNGTASIENKVATFTPANSI